MTRSTSRILTTHTGSLPRTGAVLDLLQTREQLGRVDPRAFEADFARQRPRDFQVDCHVPRSHRAGVGKMSVKGDPP